MNITALSKGSKTVFYHICATLLVYAVINSFTVYAQEGVLIKYYPINIKPGSSIGEALEGARDSSLMVIKKGTYYENLRIKSRVCGHRRNIKLVSVGGVVKIKSHSPQQGEFIVTEKEVRGNKKRYRDKYKIKWYSFKSHTDFKKFPFKPGSFQTREIDRSRHTLVIIHGKNQSAYTWPKDIAYAYRHFEPYRRHNIILVDWSSITQKKLVYLRLQAPSTKKVGIKLARSLKRDLHLDLDKLTILGHSLGAHVAGAAGSELSRLHCGKQVRKIIGLDPAGPWFGGKKKSKRLDAGDAQMTIVVHTSTFYGYDGSIGDIDIDLGSSTLEFYDPDKHTTSYQTQVDLHIAAHLWVEGGLKNKRPIDFIAVYRLFEEMTASGRFSEKKWVK